MLSFLLFKFHLYLLIYLYLFVYYRAGYIYSNLTSNSVYSQRWPWTSDPPVPPKNWDYRGVPACPVYAIFGIEPTAFPGHWLQST